MDTYVVTFSNEDVCDAGEQPTFVNVEVRVDFGRTLTEGDVDAHAEQLVEYAVLVWHDGGQDRPVVDWSADEPGWFAISVTLPSGQVVELG